MREKIKYINWLRIVHRIMEEIVYEDRLKKVFRGEIWIAELPINDISIQGGCRPLLVISNNACNKYSSVVTAIPVTTKIDKRRDLPTHVEIVSDTGIRNMILCEQLISISRKGIKKLLYKLNDEQLKQVEKCLQIQLVIIEVRRDYNDKIVELY